MKTIFPVNRVAASAKLACQPISVSSLRRRSMSAAMLRSITEASAGLLFAEASARRSESWEDSSAIGYSEAHERARPHCLSLGGMWNKLAPFATSPRPGSSKNGKKSDSRMVQFRRLKSLSCKSGCGGESTLENAGSGFVHVRRASARIIQT
jgi:hypothetical protein